MRVTSIVPPSGLPMGGPREFDAVDEFVSAVSAVLAAEIPILETPLSEAPTDGYLLLFGDADLAAYQAIGSRIVLINADRSTVSKKTERLSLVAAIEKHRYFHWKTQRSEEDGSGLIGLKTLAPTLGAAVEDGPYLTQNYGCFSSSSSRDLPSLLAHYLTAHAGSRGPQAI
jgi:hypothetical protein